MNLTYFFISCPNVYLYQRRILAAEAFLSLKVHNTFIWWKSRTKFGMFYLTLYSRKIISPIEAAPMDIP